MGDSVVNELARLASQIQSGMSASVGEDEISLAYLTALEVIAHNLANVETVGFKRMRVQFQELLGAADQEPGSALATGEPPLGARLKLRGAKATCTTRIFSTGDLTQTGEALDLAIRGDGFFEVMMPDGRGAYTRDGAFRIAPDGHLVTSDGFLLRCGFQSTTAGTTSITISSSGQANFQGPQGATSSQLQLCKFANPAGLEAIGRNLYRETVASGRPDLGKPSENGFGELAQGFLELSNVKVVEELVDLIRIQRAYEVYSKAVAINRKLRAQANLADY